MKVKGSLYWIYSFISGCKGKMLVAILLAVIGVLCGMAPYFALAGILSGLIQNTLTAERIICYVGIAVLGETLKMLFNTVSSLKAHRAAYHILGNIRCKLAEKMMRVPMGIMVDTPSGKLKAMVVDTVDKLEQPLAHMLPEITANVFTPLCIIILLFILDWRMALACMIVIPIGIEPNKINARVQEVAHGLKIENLLGRSVFGLSGGEKQILALASIYAVNPDIYVLDEPTANIDKDGIDRLHEILLKLKQMGKTIVISEHRLYFLMDLVDKAVYIEHGVIQKVYTGDEFRALADSERIRLGLRCFTLDNEKDEVPTKCNSGILEIDNLSVSYKNRTIFSNASFAAARGDIIAVTGRNGSGKSAFLRVLCGLMKEKAGRIVFDGKPYPYKKRRELCYMTMQDVVHQLFSDSVWEEFSLLNKTVDEQEITKILRRLDLLDYKDKHPMTLSGGQKQRLALAVATLANKDIMIFDEPTSGLDYGNMIKVCELIKELSSNRIVFVATHDRELMGLLCTRRMEISNESISVYDLTTK